MRTNVLQFSYYSIDIFNALYDSFPIVSCINSEDMIQRYIKIQEDEKIKELKISIDMANIIDTTSKLSDDINGLTDEQKERTKERKREIDKFENSKKSEMDHQRKILDGTFLFLKEEGFIRNTEGNCYQLTAKGFSHLNKEFHDKSISDSRETYIESIKSIISVSSSIFSGVSVKIISEMLKNS